MNITLIFLLRKSTIPMAVNGISGKHYGNSQFLRAHNCHALTVPSEKWTTNRNEMAMDVARAQFKDANGLFTVVPEAPATTSTLSTAGVSSETPTTLPSQDAPETTQSPSPFDTLLESDPSKVTAASFEGVPFMKLKSIAKATGVNSYGLKRDEIISALISKFQPV